MRMRTGVYWSVGAGGGKNQDSLSLQQARLRRGDTLLALVCDGIGGLALGEEASSLAVRRMTYWFYHEYKELLLSRPSKDLILIALQRQIEQIQEILQTFQKEQKIQAGTTFTGILFFKKHYILMHIGDSRVYQIQKRWLPLGKEIYQVRRMTGDDRSREGYLTRCLGAGGRDRVRLEMGRVPGRAGYLICSDGFYRGLTDPMIGQVLGPLLYEKSGGESQIKRRLEMLGSRSRQAGVKDDQAAVGIMTGGKE